MYYAEFAIDDKEKLKQVHEVAKICSDITHENRCHRAVLIGRCMKENTKLRNVLQYYMDWK